MTSSSPVRLVAQRAVLEQVEQLEARKAALQGVDAARTDDAGSRGSEHHSTHIDPTTGHPRDPFDAGTGTGTGTGADDAGSRGSEHHSTHTDPATGHALDPFDTIADQLLDP